jgi:hypothetical protein
MDTSHPARKRIVRTAAMLLGAFLLGLLPGVVRNIKLSRELEQAQARLEMARTRELAALTYLEVSRNNFGIAAQHATALYEQLKTVAQTAEEPARSVAAEALQQRDSVTGMLATADPAARIHLQELAARLLMTDSGTARARVP